MQNIEEIWKDVPGYEGKYQASSLGRIRSTGNKFTRKNGVSFCRPGTILAPHANSSGYMCVTLRKYSGEERRFAVHRLIIISFVGLDKNKNHVDHINSNKLDNRIINLQWVTQQENNAKQYYPRHENRYNANLSIEDVKKIRAEYKYADKRSGFFRKTAEKYGVSEGCIGGVVYNKCWIGV